MSDDYQPEPILMSDAEAMSEDERRRPLPGDEHILVRFYDCAIQNKFRSEQEGRAIFDRQEWVEIVQPGDSRTIIRRQVKYDWDNSAPGDPFRWPKQWERFKARRAQVQDGTPIEELASIGVERRAELKHMHVHTVEQLANLTDAACQNLGMNTLKERARAKAFLGEVSEPAQSGEVAALKAQIAASAERDAARDQEMTQLRQMMAQMLDGASGARPPRRTRGRAARTMPAPAEEFHATDTAA